MLFSFLNRESTKNTFHIGCLNIFFIILSPDKDIYDFTHSDHTTATHAVQLSAPNGGGAALNGVFK